MRSRAPSVGQRTARPSVWSVAVRLTRGQVVDLRPRVDVTVGPWTPAVPDGYAYAVRYGRDGTVLALTRDAYEAARDAVGRLRWPDDVEATAIDAQRDGPTEYPVPEQYEAWRWEERERDPGWRLRVAVLDDYYRRMLGAAPAAARLLDRR